MKPVPPSSGGGPSELNEAAETPKVVKKHAGKSRRVGRRTADLRNALAARAVVLILAVMATPGLSDAVGALIVKLLKALTTKIP